MPKVSRCRPIANWVPSDIALIWVDDGKESKSKFPPYCKGGAAHEECDACKLIKNIFVCRVKIEIVIDSNHLLYRNKS